MRHILIALALLVPGLAWGQPTLPPAVSQLRTQPANGASAIGLAAMRGLAALQRIPTVNDDITRGVLPTQVWRYAGRQWVNISNALGAAVWEEQTNLPLPGDVVGFYVSSAAASGGSGYATNDTITLLGGVVAKALSVSGGALTPPSGCAGYQSGTTLTITTSCTSGTLAIGEVIAAAGITAPGPTGIYGTYIVSGSGSTWTVNTSQTVGSAGSPVAISATAVQVTQPKLKGACAASVSGLSQIATSGSGTGASFTLSVIYPSIYAQIRATNCYSGNLLQVTNSKTGASTNIGYLSDNTLDFAAVQQAVTSSLAMEQYGYYTDGPEAQITTRYDQGGNGYNQTAPSGSSPIIFGGRKIGKVPAALFASGNGGSPVNQANSYLQFPSALTFDTSNTSVIWAGGVFSGSNSRIWQFVNSGVTAFSYLDASPTTPNCALDHYQNASVVKALPSTLSETPQVVSCVVINRSQDGSGIGGLGNITSDTTMQPTPYTNTVVGTNAAVAGKTATITIGTGANCYNQSSYTFTYTLQSSNAFNEMQAFGQTANQDPTLAGLGITTSSNIGYNLTVGLKIYQPINSTCSITVGGTWGLGNWTTDGPGANFGGGIVSGGYSQSIEGGSSTTATQVMYDGLMMVVPWPLTVAEQAAIRQSIHYWFGFDGKPRLILNVASASSWNGYLDPFYRDLAWTIYQQLGGAESGVAVWNRSGTGESLVYVLNNGLYTKYQNIGYQFTTGLATNNIFLPGVEVNSLSSVASETTLYNAFASLYSKFNGISLRNAVSDGWTSLCGTEPLRNAGATTNGYSQGMAGLLLANPAGAGCNAGVVNPLTIPIFNHTSLLYYPAPMFSASGGSHPGYGGIDAWASLYTTKILSLVQP